MQATRNYTAQPEVVAKRAYEIWLAKGATHGHSAEDWFQAERELAPRTIVLSNAGANKIGLVRELREILGMSLEHAREIVEHAPSTVKSGASVSEAQSVRERLTALGAAVEIR